MSKSRKNREREKQQPPQQPPQKPRRLWTAAKTLFAATLAFCTLLGIAVLWPRITIEPYGAFDPSSPSPLQFKISNIGFVPLTDIAPRLGICRLAWQGRPALLGPCDPPRYLVPAGWQHAQMGMDEWYLISLDDAFKTPQPTAFESGDISIYVEYHPWFLPWTRHKESGFFTKKQNDGKLYWFPK
jgi:hypothetical protein